MTDNSLRIVVADAGQAYAPDRDYGDAIDLNLEISLVDPFMAVRWIANRSFMSVEEQTAVRKWYRCLEADLAVEAARDEGALNVAAAVLGDAVERGDVRCAFVVASDFTDWNGAPVPRLELLDLDRLRERGYAVRFTTDDGYVLCVDVGDQSGAQLQLSDFHFFWEDVARLWPGDPESTSPPPVPAAGSGQLVAPTLRLGTRGRRGRQQKPHGQAFAGLIARAHAHGIEQALREKNTELGEWLRAEYAKLGDDPLPTPEDAGRNARAVLQALQAAIDA